MEEQPKREFIPPTREQMKVAIKDPSTPEVVRRHLRTEIYGLGGGGHKAVSQETAQRIKVTPGVHTKPTARPPAMSGRQWKKARRLLREATKIVRQVEK